MSATLLVSRPSRLADLIWPYEVIVDGQPLAQVRSGGSVRMPVAPGTHTLRIRSLHIINRRLGLGSPTTTLEVGVGGTAQFECHPHPFMQCLYWWFACLVGPRSGWIVLTHADPHPSQPPGRAGQGASRGASPHAGPPRSSITPAGDDQKRGPAAAEVRS